MVIREMADVRHKPQIIYLQLAHPMSTAYPEACETYQLKQD